MGDTDIDTPEAPAATPADTVPEPIDIGGWPTWLRRTIILVALSASFALFAWGSQGARSGGGDDKLDGAIVALSPVDGAQALRQTSVGAELAPGYDGRLTVNGIAIPEDQMDGAIDPASVSAEDLERYGLRPNNRNRVYFTPGPGKVIEEYDTGAVTIALRYFEERQEASARTVNWSIRVD